MIVLNIRQSDIGFRDSPLAISFIRTYGNLLPNWKMTIGRDYGYLYLNSGYIYQFDLSIDAWSYNLMWHRTKTAKPDPALILTMKDIVTPLTEQKHGFTLAKNSRHHNPEVPIRIESQCVV